MYTLLLKIGPSIRLEHCLVFQSARRIETQTKKTKVQEVCDEKTQVLDNTRSDMSDGIVLSLATSSMLMNQQHLLKKVSIKQKHT
jgi:hypothetical protein